MNKKTGEKDKNPRAAAIRYNPERNGAPRIVGIGQGEVARAMIQTAQDNNVAIVENPSLCDVLGSMNIGDEIPEELYDVVAEILVFISRMDDARSNHSPSDKARESRIGKIRKGGSS